MSETKQPHSPEPWQQGETDNASAQVWDAENKTVGTIHTGFGIVLANEAKQKGGANVRRIIACVNACRGIPVELLESGKLIQVWTYASEPDGQFCLMAVPLDVIDRSSGVCRWLTRLQWKAGRHVGSFYETECGGTNDIDHGLSYHFCPHCGKRIEVNSGN